jgi:hypothetical protein
VGARRDRCDRLTVPARAELGFGRRRRHRLVLDGTARY